MIPVHVAVEKNIRNAVEEKSKWRIDLDDELNTFRQLKKKEVAV